MAPTRPANNGAMYQAIEKLTGADNYSDWVISMQAYLQMDVIWNVIKVPEGGTLDTYEENNVQTRSRIIMTTMADVRTHFDIDDSAKVIWDKLKSVYDDNALSNVCNTLRELPITQLDDCGNVDEYIAMKCNAAKHLRANGIGPLIEMSD